MSQDGIEGVETKLPISRSDSDDVARQFIEHWSPADLVKKGLHQAVRDLIYRLQDHGEIVILTVNEGHALSEWLVNNDIGMEVFEDDFPESEKELQSAVKKLLFANGRCFGMTDADMGIYTDEEEHDGE